MSEPQHVSSSSATVTVGPPSYIVLHKDDSGYWSVVVESVEARGSHAAIKAVVSKGKDTAGEFVAVPVSSWKPVTVRTETQTVVKLEDA